MKRTRSKTTFLVSALTACAAMAFTSGCASGGYKLTRQYARWVNSQNIIIRIILYLLTLPVYALTLLIDLVLFNTVDFWQGRVAAGDYHFKDGEKTYLVHHEFQPGTQLKHSRIQILSFDQQILQQVELTEMASGEIELRVDGQLRSRVHGISSIPVATLLNNDGRVQSEHFIPFANPDFSERTVAKEVPSL